MKSFYDIIADGHSELNGIAAECGIDWSKAAPFIFNGETTLERGIELEPKFKGKVKLWVDRQHTKQGHEFPVIRFNTLKFGGVSTTFSGYDYLIKDLGYTPKPQKISAAQKKLAQQKQQERQQKQAEQQIKQAQLKQKKIDRFNQFDRLFQSLPAVTQSAYLERKHIAISDLPQNFILKQGQDARGTYIAFALNNTQQKVVGYQRIYDAPFQDTPDSTPRDKDFIFLPDSKKGSYTLIGKAQGKSIDIAEGLATAISCYIATGKVCAVALDANNLNHVVQHFSFSPLNIRIIADNDINLKDGGNVGLFAALKIAHEYKAKVVYPELNAEKCDFNDVLIAKGKFQVRKQLNTHKLFSQLNTTDFHYAAVQYAPQPQLKKVLKNACFYFAHQIATLEHYKTVCAKLNAATKDRGIKKHTVRHTLRRMFIKYSLIKIREKHSLTHLENTHRVDASQLNNAEIAQHILKQQGIFVDARGMGAGKTEVMGLVAEQVKKRDINQRKVVYICPRVSLASGGAKRLDLRYYEDVQTYWGESSDRLSVCINSIPKHGITDTNCLMLDEFRQMLEFISIGSVKNRQEVQDTLIEAINNAETVILADADFNDFSLQWLQEHTNKTIQVIQAQGSTHQKQITTLADSESLLVEANKQLQAGKNIWITSDSKIQVHKSALAFNLLAEDMQGDFDLDEDEILIITGDNKGEAKQADFLKNPDEESKKYRLIISTPVISSGVSITNDHFEKIYALFSNVVPANEMIQAIGRVRAVKDIQVAFKKGHIQAREIEQQALLDGEQLKNSRFLGGRLYEVDALAYQQAQITASLNDSLNNFSQEFLILAQIKGYTIKKKAVLHKIQGLNKRASEKDIQRVLTAAPIAEETAKQLKRNKPDTQAERDSLDRYLVEEMAGKPSYDLNEEDIQFYKNQGSTTIQNHELIHSDIVDIRSKETQQHDEQGETKGITSRALFMQEIIEMLKGKKFTAHDVTDALIFLQQNHKELTANHLGNFRSIQRPIAKLKNLLKKMGYDLLQVQRTSYERVYQIEENPTVLTYIKNRQAMKLKNDTKANYI